jgi:hypothetical protein
MERWLLWLQYETLMHELHVRHTLTSYTNI